MTDSLIVAMRDMLLGRVAEEMEVFRRLRLRSATPWPVSGDFLNERPSLTDYLFALWNIAERAIEAAGEGLGNKARVEAQQASDGLFLVAHTFAGVEAANREASLDNLAALFFLGVRFKAPGKARGRGRPPGTNFAEADQPLVDEVTRRVAKGECAKTICRELAALADGGGTEASRADRIYRRFRGE